MERVVKFAKDNWELAVLVVTCIVVAFSVVVFFCGGEEEEDTMAAGRKTLGREKALSEKAFAFLRPKKAECARNPFALTVSSPEPPKKAEPLKKTEPPKKVEPPKQVEEPPKPVAEPKEEPIAEIKPQEVAPQIVGGTFEFMFQRRNSDGRTVAVVRTQLAGGERNVFTVGVGDGVQGVKVIAISDDRIGLQDARGNRGTIPLGEKRNVWFQTPAATAN